ncbi:MAG: hypothetical protein ACRDXB_11865 [Actinomycetes bacterium]
MLSGPSQMIDAAPLTAHDGRQHLVPDYALAEWRQVGVYPVRCGAWVPAASMAEPVRRCCYLCAPGRAT